MQLIVLGLNTNFFPRYFEVFSKKNIKNSWKL